MFVSTRALGPNVLKTRIACDISARPAAVARRLHTAPLKLKTLLHRLMHAQTHHTRFSKQNLKTLY